MGKTLYLECESGISGDMTVAALLDLGADQQVLKKALASLPVQGFDIRISRVKKSGLDACDFLYAGSQHTEYALCIHSRFTKCKSDAALKLQRCTAKYSCRT